jgi:adenylate cyclase
MRESRSRNLLRRIQDIVADGGRALDAAANQRLEDLLTTFVAGEPGVAAASHFSHQQATIMFADLRGFTALASAHPAPVVLELLNHWLSAMSATISRLGGTIDKFTGDAIMAVFFAPAEQHAEAARRAVHCAVDMQLAMEALNGRNREAGLPSLYMGMGLNTGPVMAGVVGSDDYCAYTVIGQEVNLTSRIEAFSLRGQILISEATRAACGSFATCGPAIDVYVKGRPQRVKLFEVVELPSLKLRVPRQEKRRSPRVRVNLPLSWQRVERKIVSPERAAGRILDIGYHGVLIESDRELPQFSEIKLEISLPRVALETGDIYARVVKSVPGEGVSRAGVEFTSLSDEHDAKLQLFVQMMLQGDEPSNT